MEGEHCSGKPWAAGQDIDRIKEFLDGLPWREADR